MANEFTVDLSNYREFNSDRVTAGRHRATVEDAMMDKSNKGDDMVIVWFRIIGGEDDGSAIVDRFVLKTTVYWKLVSFMQALGLPTPKKKIKVNLRNFLGKHLDLDIDDGEPYRGQVRSEVRGYVAVAKKPDQVEDIEDDEEEEEEEEDEEEKNEEDSVLEPEPELTKEEAPKRKKKRKPEPEPESEEDDEDVDLDSVEI